MDIKAIGEEVKQYRLRLNREFEHFKSKEYYVEINKRWLKIIEEECSKEAQPFLKLILSWKVVLKYIDDDVNDSDLIEGCLKIVIDNMDYVMANDYDPEEWYHLIFTMDNHRPHNFHDVLINRFPVDAIERYVDYTMLQKIEEEADFSSRMCNLTEIVENFEFKEDYENAKKFGYKALAYYERIVEKRPELNIGNCLRYHDYTELLILDIIIDYEGATESELERAQELREKLQDRKEYTKHIVLDRRAELLDEAERCRAAGDMQGCHGYLSALGDIGR